MKELKELVAYSKKELTEKFSALGAKIANIETEGKTTEDEVSKT